MGTRFDRLAEAYALCKTSRTETGRPAADYREARDMLPLPPQREHVRQMEPARIANSWASAVGEQAQHLANLVHVHNNGGTASSPKKIKAAALELIRLLGED